MAKIIVLNKPFNVLCQFTDNSNRSTLADYINLKGFYPAGRLDYDSEGLVVLTNNGKLQHQISHPTAKLSKTYWAQVEGSPSEHDLKPLRAGIRLKDGLCRAANVSLIEPPQCWPRNPPIRQRQHIPTSWLEIVITEGRNRQVRRMTAAIGFPTLRLIRSRVGQWSIDGINPGQYKYCTLHTTQKKSNCSKHNTPKRNTKV